jgi:hypothetical protein
MLNFTTQDEQNKFINLRGLVNKNQGLFKSEKQAQFLFKQAKAIALQNSWQPDFHYNNFGVPIGPDQSVIHVDAIAQWADYGSRSLVPVIIVFVIDINGVVAQYKVGGTGNLREGWKPIAAKTKLVWQRPADTMLPNFSEKQVTDSAEINPGEWVGSVGEKVNIDVKIVNVRDFGYGQFGVKLLTVLNDSKGNVINVWRNLGPVGTNLKITGVVKDCSEYKLVKQTTLTRVKIA